MRPTDNPCYKCTERKLHCHGKCKKRAEWEKKRTEEAARINAARKTESDMNAYVFEHMEKSIRRRKK